MNKKPSQLRAFWSIAWYSLRAQTRNPATFFFGFIFPIVFISIFGLIGSGPQKYNIGLTKYSDESSPIYKVLSKQNFIEITKGFDDELKTQLAQGKLVSILSIDSLSRNPNAYVVRIINSSALPQESAAVKTIIEGLVDKTNLKLSGVANPPITIESSQISGRAERYIDFALPGQIGFSLLSTAIFGTVFGLIYLKKALVLKRMFATPTKPLTILLAQGASRLIIALLQTLLIIGIGVLVFKFFLPHGFITFFELLILSVVGLIAFLGFGYFMAGLANDENAAGPLVNLVTLPQFLLSGTFFSTENLPTWLQPVANNLPLSYFNIAVRKVTTEGGTLVDTWPYMLGLLIWGAAMYILAAKTFKWE